MEGWNGMYRVKVALIAGSAVAIVTAVCLVYVTSAMNDGTTKRVESDVEHAEAQFLRSARLEAVELSTKANNLAREDEFTKVFTAPGEDDRRRAAFVAVEARQARLEAKEQHKAAILAVVDKTGKVVARDLNINSLYGDALSTKFPSLATALTSGAANKDIWNMDGQMYRVGSAPIRWSNGDVVGGLVIGYVQSVNDAKAEKDRLGAEVAYFLDGKIQASSFARGEGQSSESAEEKALASQLFEGPKLADAALDEHEATRPFHVKLGGEDWVGAAAPLPGNATKSKSGFVVLASLTAAKSQTGSIDGIVIGLGIFGLLATLGAAMMTARRFLGPLDKIESGVAEVINGNQDYVFESPSPDFEGLANGLNVMLARLLGRPEPGEEDEDSSGGEDEGGRGGRWKNENLFVDEASATAGSAPAAETTALAEEPADAYYQRIWTEYEAARKQTGEGTQGLNAESFIGKLKQNEAALCKKYNAKMVRFKVQIKGNQTTLKPVPIL